MKLVDSAESWQSPRSFKERVEASAIASSASATSIPPAASRHRYAYPAGPGIISTAVPGSAFTISIPVRQKKGLAAAAEALDLLKV